MDSTKQLPIYARLSIIVMGTLAFFYILYIGREIAVPLVFATIIAILLNPLVNFLCNKKVNRIIAIFLAVSTALTVFTALMYFIGSQLSMFSDSLPQLKQNFSVLLNDTITWISQTFNISESKIHAWLIKMKGEGLNNSSALIGKTLGTIGGIFV